MIYQELNFDGDKVVSAYGPQEVNGGYTDCPDCNEPCPDWAAECEHCRCVWD